MKYNNALIFLVAILTAITLIIGGGYTVINNLIEPKGQLFEGIVLASLGIIMTLLIAVATTVGKTIMMFSEYLKKLAELKKQQEESSPFNVLGNLMKNSPGSISIHDLGTGESKTTDFKDKVDGVKKMNDIISDHLSSFNKNASSGNQEKTIEQLEADLADAVKKEQYEKA